MSLASININTETQECLLVIDGQLVPADEIEFYYGTDYNGAPMKEFKYTVTTTNPDGTTLDMEYKMMTPDIGPNVQDQGPGIGGLISREIKTKDRLYKEVEAFVNESEGGANTKVVKNGPASNPYCVISAKGHNFGCYATTQEAQKRSDQVNNFGKKP